MDSSPRLFRISLYEEHLEEASFLYEQVKALIRDPEIPWTGLADFQERLEAHIDALIVGEGLAMTVCQKRALEGDAGELFAAVCVVCRQAKASVLADLLSSVDLDDRKRVAAITDALKQELPAEWTDFCLRAIEHGDARLVPILARAAGYRRLPADAALLLRLDVAENALIPAVLWSIGRIRAGAAIAAVRTFVDSEDPAIVTAALRTALRLGDDFVVSRLMSSAREAQADRVALGLAGGDRMALPLVEALEDATPVDDTVMALALLGDPSAVRPLAGLLMRPETAGMAADALQVITGASLFETVLVAEELSEDEMLPHELAAFRETGELPRRPDGQPFGVRVRRVSRDPAVWADWLKANARRFTRGYRYRFGEPCTPRVLLDCLSSETFPNSFRPWLAEELLIRYGIDLPFEADMRVGEQSRVLAAAAARIEAASARFEPGRWYFAGQLIS
jgi:hypothetical protein